MLRALGELFDKTLGRRSTTETADERRHALQVATALLMIEVARADFREDLTEDQAVFDLLKRYFALTEGEASLLVEQARSKSDHVASLQGFTRELHERLGPEEKLRVVEMLWEVALADSHLDKHEDYVIRKIAGLLYVPHGDLIRIRNKVRGL